MSLSCEKVRTSDRTAQEESYLENRSRPKGVEIDNVNHPPHYNNSEAHCDCGRSIECIDITRHMNFNIGNAVKYLWRCDLKGRSVEDLKKAIWYIQDEIAERSRF